MARLRKTIEVRHFVERCNVALNAPDSEYNTPDIRRGIASAVEQALHQANAYAGFQNTDPNRKHTDEGYLIEGSYDDTRRAYYVKGEPFSFIQNHQRRA